ncbi:MAG: tRNA (adenine-N1)-methyltransferase [Anaerolineae bacterium]|nr:tRNA (adenine-N1)-methyltransferase [Anaerolineae bacterium]
MKDLTSSPHQPQTDDVANSNTKSGILRAGDIVLIVSRDKREFFVRLEPGKQFQNHQGVLEHDNLIGQKWGATVESHLGYAHLLLPPSLEQLIRNIKRNTQIIYPKEIGYILMKMNIGPGTRVLEAGTGSGGLTLALARMVMPYGHVYTYEAREDIQSIAIKNIENFGLTEFVTFKLRDIETGFDECNIDALFLDVREPWLYLDHVHAALKGGGFFGALLPTTNQVADLLYYMQYQDFGFIEVEELFLRAYKPIPRRLRPTDRMIAHTGYLVFARALLHQD